MSHLDRVKEKAGFVEKPEDPVNSTIYTLKTDSDLPTVIVEGRDDQVIYTWMRRLLNVPTKIDVLPVGNRDNVIEIYERRSEFDSRLPVAFMADLDKWVFDKRDKGGPAVYSDIIWTKGYSLENDLYSDGNPENTIAPAHQEAYKDALDAAIQDFAKDVAIWASYGRTPDPAVIKKYYNEIWEEYQLRLRGKTLFNVLHKFCFCGARNHLELCKDVFDTIDLTEGDPPLLSDLILRIQKKIKDKQNAMRKAEPSRKFTAESLFAKLSK